MVPLVFALLVVAAQAGNVVELNDANFDEIVLDAQKDVLVEFYAPWCGHCKNLAPTYEEVATALLDRSEFVVAMIDATAESAGGKYGVKGFPTIKMFRKDNKEDPEEYSGGRTKEDIIAYITGEKPEAPPSDVVTLTTENFDEIALDADKDVLVEFYAPWCGHCKALAGTWEELAAATLDREDIVIAKLDATAEPEVGTKYEVSGYPTLKMFKKDNKETPEKYEGGRDLDSLLEYVTGVPASVYDGPVAVGTTANFEEIAMGEDTHVLVEFYAPWCGHCKTLEPIWEVVAGAFADEPNVVVAKVDATKERELGDKYGVKGFPTLKYFAPGAEKVGAEYNGGRDAKSFVGYLNDKAGTERDVDGNIRAASTRLGLLDKVVAGLADQSEEDSSDVIGKVSAAVGRVVAVFEAENHKSTGVSKVYQSITAGLAKDSDFLSKHADAMTAVLAKGNGDDEEPRASVADRKAAQLALGALNGFKGSKGLNVKSLKEFARQNGIDISGAADKSDLQRAVRKGLPTGEARVEAAEAAVAAAEAVIQGEKDKAAERAKRKEESKKREEERKKKKSAVVALTDFTFQKLVMDETKTVLVEFYAPWCGHCKTLAPEYEALAEEYKDNDDIVIAKLDGTYYSKSAAAYDAKSYPTIILFTKEDKTGDLKFDGERNQAGMKKFIESGGQGANEDEMEDEEAEADSNVVPLSAKQFKDIALDESKDVLVEFFAPWCGHCKNLIPVYEEVATEFADNDNVVVATVDATKYRKLASKYDVTGFPTIKFFGKGTQEAAAYEGGRDKDSMVSFLKRGGKEPEIEDDVQDPESDVIVLTRHNFDDVVLDESQNVLVEFYAPWCGHCKRLTPVYEEVATEVKAQKDIVLAKVDATKYKKIGSKYGVSGFPTLKWFSKADKSGDESYEGAREKEDLIKFVTGVRSAAGAASDAHDEL